MEEIQRTEVTKKPLREPLSNLLDILEELRSELVASKEQQQERLKQVIENVRSTTNG